MAAKMLSARAQATPVVAQAGARAPRVGAFTGFMPSKAALLGKSSEATFSSAVSGRVGVVQVDFPQTDEHQLASQLGATNVDNVHSTMIGLIPLNWWKSMADLW